MRYSWTTTTTTINTARNFKTGSHPTTANPPRKNVSRESDIHFTMELIAIASVIPPRVKLFTDESAGQ